MDKNYKLIKQIHVFVSLMLTYIEAGGIINEVNTNDLKYFVDMMKS